MTDAHVHIGRDGGRTVPVPRFEYIRGLLNGYARLGISGIRDCGDEYMCGLIARELSDECGVAVKTPVYALSKSGGYGAFLGKQVSGISEIKQALQELSAYKPDFIKIVQSGIVSFDEHDKISVGGFERDELSYIVQYAKDSGLKTVAHCNGAENVRIALSACVDCIEHGYYIGSNELDMMLDAGAIWTPTFVPLSNYLKSTAVPEAQKPVLEQALARHGENLRNAVRKGIRVAAGSDAGASFVGHGQGVLDEIECFVAAGISRDAALRIADESSAEIFS